MKKLKDIGFLSLITMVLGLTIGLFFPKTVLYFAPVGDIFIRLIRMLIVPLILFGIINSISNFNSIKKLREIGGKTMFFYILTLFIAATIGLLIANLFFFNLSPLLSETDSSTAVIPTFWSILTNFFPQNIFESMTNSNIIQIIIFAVFFGISMILTEDKATPLKKVIISINTIMYKMISIIILITPLGIFALMANTTVQYGFNIFGILLKYVLAIYTAHICLILILYLPLIKFCSRIRIKKFFVSIYKVLIVAFTTSSSSATMPLTMKTLKEDLNISEDIVDLTLPLGTTINMNGAIIFLTATIIFISNVSGIHLSILQQIGVIFYAIIVSIAVPGIPGGGLVLVTTLTASFGLPINYIGIIGGAYRIIDMGDTAVNVLGNIICTTIINSKEKTV